MSKNKNGEKGRLTTGVIAALAICAVLCGIYALLIKNGKLEESGSVFVISSIIAVSAAIGGIIANAGRGRGGLHGIVTGSVFAAILCAVPLAAYPDDVNWLRIIQIFIISAVGGFLGGVINLCKSNKSFHKSRK